MNKDYVSYDLALKLKECGFDEPCKAFYIPPNKSRTEPSFYDSPYTFKNHPAFFYIAAPTLWLAQKWLREKYHISVRVSYIAYHKVWFADWLNLDNGEFDDTDATFATYEEALSDGIETALELIKKGE